MYGSFKMYWHMKKSFEYSCRNVAYLIFFYCTWKVFRSNLQYECPSANKYRCLFLFIILPLNARNWHFGLAAFGFWLYRISLLTYNCISYASANQMRNYFWIIISYVISKYFLLKICFSTCIHTFLELYRVDRKSVV